MAIQSSSVDNAKTTEVASQPIQQTAAIGGTGGNQSVCALGSYITRLSVYQTTSPYYWYGLQLTFDSGETVTFGTPPPSGSTWTSLDLTSDSISKMYVLTTTSTMYGGNNVGCIGLYIETVKGQTFAPYFGYSPATAPTGLWQLVSSTSNEPCENFFLVGAQVRSGTAIDSVSFLYKEDVLMTRVINDFVYTDWTTSAQTPINVASAIVENQTSETQQMGIAFEKSVSSSYTWGVDAGLKLGVSASFETGLPYIAEGEVQVSAEVSFNASYGQTHSVSEAFSYNAIVSVPAGKTFQSNATASSSSIRADYSAIYIENWAHAGAVTEQITGTIKGLTAYNVAVSYTDVTPATSTASAVSGD